MRRGLSQTFKRSGYLSWREYFEEASADYLYRCALVELVVSTVALRHSAGSRGGIIDLHSSPTK